MPYLSACFRSLRRVAPLIGSVAALAAIFPARAAVTKWVGLGLDANWSTGLNWDGAVPGSTVATNNTDTAVFNSVFFYPWGRTALNPVIIDSATQNIGSVSFDGAVDSYFLGSTAGNALRLSSGGAIQILGTLTTSAAVQTVNAPLEIQGADGTYTFANHSANGNGPGSATLKIGGATSGGAAGATGLTLGGSNTNGNTIDGVIGDGSATSLSLNKTGAGRWHLTGANTFSGSITVTGGTLLLGKSNAYASGTVISGGTLIARHGGALGTGSVTVSAVANFTYAASANVPLIVGGSLSVTAGTGTVLGGSIGGTGASARIAVAGAATISDGAHSVNVYGITGTTPATGAYTLLEGGAGTSLNPATAPTLGTVFNNTNFTVNTGTPFTRTATALQVNITAATPLTTAYWKGGLAGATQTWAASDGSTQSNWRSTVSGGVQPLVPGALADVVFISSPFVTTAPTASVLGADMSIASLTIGGGSSLSVAVNDDGFTLTIAPSNPALGITKNALGGSLTLNNTLNVGAPQTWKNSGVSTLTVGGLVDLGANQLTLHANGGSIALNGPLVGTGGIRKTGTSSLDLNGASSFTGAVSVEQGRVQVSTLGGSGQPGGLGAGTSPVVLGGGGNDVTLSYFGASTASDRPFTLNTGAQTIDVRSSTTLALSGVIDGAGGLFKRVNGGTLQLSGSSANTFAGTTEVAVGTLLLDKGGSANAIAGGGLTISGGVVRYTGSSTDMMGAGPVSIQGGGQLDFNGKTDTIGNVSVATTSNAIPAIKNTAGGGNLTIGTLDIAAAGSVLTSLDLGTGTLTLGGDASFAGSDTGRARISGGTLALPATRTFLVGALAGGGFDFEIESTISGAGGLTKSGSGRLLLTAANSYTGTTSIGGGTLIARNAAALNPTTGGAVRLSGGTLNYFATADAALGLASTLEITGTATIGGSLGATSISAQISVAGPATSTGEHTVNVFSLTGTQPAGTYTLVHGGGGSTLDGATYSLGTVFNNTNFTVGTPSATATDLQVAVTSAAPLTAAFWKGGLPGATTVLAASNGSTASNWIATADGALQGLVPGAGADVTFSAPALSVAPINLTLGANLSIRSLTVSDTLNGLSVLDDGHALTLGAGGLTVNPRVPASILESGLILGTSQTWAQHSLSPLTVSGPISGTAGFTKTGPGTLLLSGSNTFTGPIAVNGGVLSIPADRALGDAANEVALGAGGTLRFTATTPISATRVITVNGTAGSPSGLDLQSSVATASGPGQIAGSGALTISASSGSFGRFAIEGANAGFTGTVNVGAPGQLIGQALVPRVFSPNTGTTLLLQNAGTLSGATAIVLNNSAALVITQSPTAITGRLGVATPLTFHNGRFRYDPNGSTAIAETFGNVAIDGLLTLTGSSTAGPAAGTTLNFGPLTRTDRATLLLRAAPTTGAGFIGGTPGAGVNYLFAEMPDAGGTAGTTSRGVVPWAAAVNSLSGSSPTDLVTYDGNGFRALTTNERAEVSSQSLWDAAVIAAQAQNLALSASVTVGSPAMVNAMVVSSPATLTGASTLSNHSGALLSPGSATFNGPTLNFPNGGMFHLGAPVSITGTSAITGVGGVTTSSLSSSSSSQLRLTNTVPNPFTGGLTINGASQVTFTANNQLGQDSAGLDAGSITLGGGQLLFSPASETTVSLSDAGGIARPIAVNASQGTISTTVASAVLQIPGVISGPGQLQFGGGSGASATGVVELANPAANNFTGGSLLSIGILRISRGDHLGTGPILLNGGQLQAGANFTLGTTPTLLTNTTIDTQAFDLTLGAGLDGTGVTSTTLTKTGAGALILAGT